MIRRTKETTNVHPMYREGHLRRKLGPVIVNKNSSQDRVIEELQGKFGIGRSEQRRRQPDDWLAEGVIVTSKPQRCCAEGGAVEVDKVCHGALLICLLRLVGLFLHTSPLSLLRSSSPPTRPSPPGGCSHLSLPLPPASPPWRNPRSPS